MEAVLPTAGQEHAHEKFPDWVGAELPPKYMELTEQIRALTAESAWIEKMGALLWETGVPLAQAVRDAFSAMGFATKLVGPSANYDLAVELDRGRRLLVQVVGSPAAIDRTAPKITRILQTLQTEATDDDRVVLVANAHYTTPFRERRNEAVTPDALKLIVALGGNFLASPTLFGIWKYSLQDLANAKRMVHDLHALAGGVYQ